MFHDGGSGVEGWKNGWKANVTNGGGGCGTAAGVSGPEEELGQNAGSRDTFSAQCQILCGAAAAAEAASSASGYQTTRQNLYNI